jgi:hypothetical protein
MKGPSYDYVFCSIERGKELTLINIRLEYDLYHYPKPCP